LHILQLHNLQKTLCGKSAVKKLIAHNRPNVANVEVQTIGFLSQHIFMSTPLNHNSSV